MPDRFDEFWALYPRKDKKYRAETAWKRLSQKNHDEIIKALPGYWFSDDPQFIPHAASFLNGRYWLDEQPEKLRPKQSLGYADWQPSEADKEFRKKAGLPELK